MALETKNSNFQDIKRIGKLSRHGVFIYDIEQNRFLFLNAAMVKIVEIDKKLLAEEPNLILRLMVEEDQEYIKLRYNEMLEKGLMENVQIRLTQGVVQKVISLNCYSTADRSHIIGFVEDVTKEKQHEDYLINFGAKKDALLDMVAQNLSSPLNLTRFTVDLIEKAVKEEKFHKLNSHVNLMREVTSECIRIIDDFLIQEHMESPEVDAKANRFDLVAKVRIVLDQLNASTPDKQIKLKTDVNHLFITGDDLKFFQIIHNLLSNAIKFTKPNGVIQATIRSRKDKVEIVIKDDGIGIPRDLQPFIFEKNSRAGRPGLKGEVSHGIGLYVVKRLTEVMNGKISFESKEDHGTKFMLEIPKQ